MSVGALRVGQIAKVDHLFRDGLPVRKAMIERDQLLVNSNKERPVVVTRISPDHERFRPFDSVPAEAQGAEVAGLVVIEPIGEHPPVADSVKLRHIHLLPHPVRERLGHGPGDSIF